VTGLDLPTTDGSLGGLTREVADLLRGRGVPTPGTEARDLVAAVLDRPRFWPVLHAAATPDSDTAARIHLAAARRAAGAPFAYAVGRACFRHLTLSVDERVLIPRPETEQLVELVLAHTRSGQEVADIGTGSGAIALSLASERRFGRVLATDVSRDALHVARSNARAVSASLSVSVEFRCGSLLAPLADERFDAIVSNPPYIAPRELRDLPASVRDWEPAQALLCAGDGLDVTEQIILQAPAFLRAGGLLALELDSRRAQRSAEIARSSGAYRMVRVRRDLTGRDRFLLATTLGVE
jgi:release factor glutamine methyltransferase